jgi:UDP-N-acetylglucosamine 2-epimerase (non-hydrolysing)
MKVILVCGARPNFVKVAPLLRAITKHNAALTGKPIEPLLVHTGQHYDFEMSQVFFRDLELPQPDIYLGVGSGTHAYQTAKIMIEFEKVLGESQPDSVIVVGDVNSTLAGALTAVKLLIPVAHVEAGLRSYDRTMPEEINRLLTDAIADYLFTPSSDGNENLKKEGIPANKVFLVGNIMVDSLLRNKAKAERTQTLSQLKLQQQGYALLTLHRPNNVDDEARLTKILKALQQISFHLPIVFPAHPRTGKSIAKFGLGGFLKSQNIQLVEPLGYLNFLNLMMNARFVMTDSGGIQEETTVLNIPCLTLRDVTERPVTVTEGTNIVVGADTEKIVAEALRIVDGKAKKGKCPELWDGKTAERIVRILARQGTKKPGQE